MQLAVNAFRKPTQGVGAFNQLRMTSRRFCSNGGATRYPRPLSMVHWAMAAGVLTCFATIEVKKRQEKGSTLIGTLMHYHKSTGVLMLGFLGARIALRLASKRLVPLPGPPAQHIAANFSHAGLYCFMTFMPVTGVLMGYYGGKGLPFFVTHIPGAEKTNKDIAKWAYTWHKKAGTFFEALVFLHIAAAGVHQFKGDRIFSRISPFAGAGLVTFIDEDEEEEEDMYV